MDKPLDTALSLEIANNIKSKAKESFNNAFLATKVLNESMYVQGFLATTGKPYKPIEHCWLELEDRIVDPTLPHLNKTEQELYYFPVQRLSIKQLLAAVEEAKEDYPDDPPLPVYGDAPYEYYGDVMLGGHDYQAAYKDALAKCKELNRPKSNEMN